MYEAILVHVTQAGEYPQICARWVCARCMPTFQAGLDKAGCGITKYSSSHSFNPLLLSKSAVNLSIQKVGDVTSLPSLEIEQRPILLLCISVPTLFPFYILSNVQNQFFVTNAFVY